MEAGGYAHVEVDRVISKTADCITIKPKGTKGKVIVPLRFVENMGRYYRVGDKNCSMCIEAEFADDNGLEGINKP